MKNVLLVSQSRGYMYGSIKEQLSDAGLNIISVDANINAIGGVTQEITSVVLYLDEDTIRESKALVLIRDRVVEQGSFLYVIGKEYELDSIKSMINTHHFRQVFHQPIDVKETVALIASETANHDLIAKKKVLVVDDSGAMLRNVKSWLEDKYQVILANSGAMAIKYLSTNRPDLVLLDYEMPVVDGSQVLEMIRTETEFKDIPVMFLTSKADRESIMKVMALKPEGYILKTKKPYEIVAEVDAFFDKIKNI